MRFDMSELPARDRYKIMATVIVPRPIAWVTTLSREGVRNAAPFSFFNMMGDDPPTIAIGIMPRNDRLKDTAANILATGEFVVNLVSERNAQAMNLTCIDAPPDIDELELAGLAVAASHSVAPDRIESAEVSFECRMLASLMTGPRQTLVVGTVLQAYIQDEYVVDADRRHIDVGRLDLIGRMHGSSTYVRTHDLFDIQRPTWAEWTNRRTVGR